MTVADALAVHLSFNHLVYPTKAQARALKEAERVIGKCAEEVAARFKQIPLTGHAALEGAHSSER